MLALGTYIFINLMFSCWIHTFHDTFFMSLLSFHLKIYFPYYIGSNTCFVFISVCVERIFSFFICRLRAPSNPGCISCRQHRVDSYFLRILGYSILYALPVDFNPFSLKVIIKKDLTTAVLLTFLFFIAHFFLFSFLVYSFVIWWFSVVSWLDFILFIFCVSAMGFCFAFLMGLMSNIWL